MNPKIKQGFIECFCKKLSFNVLFNKKFTDAKDQKICWIWYQKKALGLSLPFVIICVIVIVNFSMQGIFRGLYQIKLVEFIKIIFKHYPALKNINIIQKNFHQEF